MHRIDERLLALGAERNAFFGRSFLSAVLRVSSSPLDRPRPPLVERERLDVVARAFFRLLRAAFFCFEVDMDQTSTVI